MVRPAAIAALSLLTAGCAATSAPDVSLDPAPPPPVEATKVSQPLALPLPGQLKPPPPRSGSKPEPADPHARVAQANRAARIEPTRRGYVNAIQVWPFTPGALYQVYASPGRVTDIALEPREDLVSVSAGDTMRWIVGDTISGAGSGQQVHILVKPSQTDLKTNLVINTSRRTYHLELTSTERTWMASVSWEYPNGQLVVLDDRNRRFTPTSSSDGVELDRVRFRYKLEGDTPSWRPSRVFDDGEKVYVEFPAGIAQSEMPPLFVIGPTGETQLVNYRAKPPYLIVDRLFGAAELRLGDGESRKVVRITRADARRRSLFGL